MNLDSLKPEECPYFQKCDAPLCPLDKEKEKGIWFPKEQICREKRFANILWIRNQKKIRKKASGSYRYFLIQMLDRDCVIRRGIEGLNPDMDSRSEQERIKTWLSKHPPKRELSQSEREAFWRKMKDARNCKQKDPLSPKIFED